MSAGETEPVDLPDPDAPEPEPEPEPDDDEPGDLDGPIVGEVERDEPQGRGPTPADLRKFERENTRHEKALAGIIGDDWHGFAPCDTCGGVGFAPTEVARGPELVEMPGVIECPGCKGYGRLRTPSRVAGQETQVCVDCAGNGWKRQEAASAPAYGNGTANQGAQQLGIPAGHILVKVDPNAPDVPQAQTAHTVGTAPVLS